MEAPIANKTVAGVDGCKAGWIGIIQHEGSAPQAAVYPTFEGLVSVLPEDAAIAVDMPIGLPEYCGPGGRGPESLVRPLLGMRQSSVFSIPSRAAVYAELGPFESETDRLDAHKRASAIARSTSDPARGVSIQAFGLFGKIREIDGLLLARPDLRTRVIESHPELAFWRLNGRESMSLPKKVKGAINPAGLAQRKALLERCGLPRSLLAQTPPAGAGADDFLDACAVMLVARRFALGLARSFPDPPGRDGHGIPVAIWA
ncbi:MAG: DUF429 domain-containing protein [Alphaproteobacteria bacterium]|nr:DUF429 domain-containing protein [Alphaproteobacteria bacterium]